MYLRIVNGNIEYPYSVEKLAKDLNASIANNISDSSLEEFDVYKVIPTPKPNDYTKNITDGTPSLVDGVYKQVWNESPASESEINARIIQKWEDIREQRNTLLKQTDWVVLVDSPVSGSDLENWKNYRQELRNVTLQENPFNIVWPTQP